MTDAPSTPRVHPVACRFAAALEVDRICVRLRDIDRRLVAARRVAALPASGSSPADADLHRVEDESEEATRQLRDARRVVEALLRLGFH